MVSCFILGIPPIVSSFVLFFLLFSCVFSARDFKDLRLKTQTFRLGEESMKMKHIKDHLMKINKPYVKSIRSPDGDIIDCVLTHLQPAFDHPELKGTMPLDPPVLPKIYNNEEGIKSENIQLWSSNGESCPQGTIPIRRTSEDDILRANSISKFGKKIKTSIKIGSRYDGHEHAIGYVNGEEYYGAKARINLWAPNVTNPHEFSISQIWVISGSFDDDDVNTVEAGWQVSPELYGDHCPRLFTYWTNDTYRLTGCYNLLCSGFVHTNNKIALGTAISPISSYKGGQYEITLLIWKDPGQGSWWLAINSGELIGYWPSTLFSRLREHATTVEFGGEVINIGLSGSHTRTQMGSGHFPSEGFGRASYVKNMEVVNRENRIIPLSDMNLLSEQPNCYDVISGINDTWGNYIFFGGPGNNPKCP